MSRALQSEKSPMSLIFSRAVSSPVLIHPEYPHAVSAVFQQQHNTIRKAEKMLHRT